MKLLTNEENICSFLADHHVLTISTQSASELWSAILFYVYDTKSQSIYIMTPLETRHGEMMIGNPKVSGTISDQVTDITQITGLQFSADVKILVEQAEISARALYEKFFPVDENYKQSMWEVTIKEAKLIDHPAVYGTRCFWDNELVK